MKETFVEMMVISELISKKLESISNSTEAESTLLVPYIRLLEEIHNKFIPTMYLNSMMFDLMINPLKKIGQTIDKPVEDGVEAQQRLQETYNLLRPIIEFIAVNMGVYDKELETKEIQEVNPGSISKDLGKILNTIKDFMKERPNIMTVTSVEEAREHAEEIIRNMENSGVPEEKILEMKERLRKACKGD